MLYSGQTDDKKIYLKGKQSIKSVKAEGEKVLIIDDSIQLKLHSEVNGMVAWHFDHCQKGCMKGINFISALWADDNYSVSLSMEVIKKECVWQEKKAQYVWQTVESKNSVFRRMVKRLTYSKQIDDVSANSWYSAKENMAFIVQECETEFVLALKSNRLVASSEIDAKKGMYKSLEALRLDKCAVKVYLKGLDFPVPVVKKVFKNGDGSSGTLYLAYSDLQLAYEQIFTLHKRRWKVEQYHKSLKNNCSLGKCRASSHSANNHIYIWLFLLFCNWKKQK